MVFETGGSTGLPKSRINIDDFRIDYEMFSETLSDESFPPGSDWLMLGPTGPRRLRLAIEHLAQHRGGISFHVDLDPRWVSKLLKMGKRQEAEAYKEHVIDQGLKILRGHPDVQCLFTTPKLLEALCEKVDLARAGHPRHLLRRHRDERPVPPLRPRGAGAGHRLRADLRQHADGPGLLASRSTRPRRTTPSPTTRPTRGRSSSWSTPTTRPAPSTTAPPAG